MDNPEKVATQGTQDTKRRKTKQKHKSIYIGHHYPQTNTNNVNKTRALIQTTGGKVEPNIFFYIDPRGVILRGPIHRLHSGQFIMEYQIKTIICSVIIYNLATSCC